MSTYSIIYNTNPYQKAKERTRARKRERIQAVKRRQAIRKQIVFAFIMFFMILASIVIVTNCLKGNQVNASSVKEETICYKTIQVEDGDTLWTLADQYMGEHSFDRQQYINEVKEMNHLSDDTIESGAYLMIPYVKTITEL